MLTKIQLQETINNLPDKITFDDLLDRLLLLQKIETGIEQSENGQIRTTNQARKILKEWLLYNGPINPWMT